MLFRHVTIRWDVERNPKKPPNVTRLLEFILKIPGYARHIKRVDIDEINYEHFQLLARRWTKQGIRSPLSLHFQQNDSLARLARDAISELRLPSADKWYRGVVYDAELGAIVALTLAQCTHLESLKVNLDFVAPSSPWEARHEWVRSGHNPWFRTMIRHAVSALPGELSRLSKFNKLTDFTVSPPRHHNGDALESYQRTYAFSRSTCPTSATSI